MKKIFIISAISVALPVLMFTSTIAFASVRPGGFDGFGIFGLFDHHMQFRGIYNPNNELSVGQCNPAINSRPVIDVSMNVKNDSDSDVAGGYWALDNYVKDVTVYPTKTSGTFCAIVTYNGGFTTMAGDSPEDATVQIPAGIQGTMSGGYRATLIGALLATPSEKTSGNLGTFDLQGGESGNQASADWISWYFANSNTVENTGFTYNWWGWQYTTPINGTWVNAATENQGNIVPVWNTDGTYTMDVLYQGNPFYYTLTLTQSGTKVGGTLADPYLPGTLAVSGIVNGGVLTFSVDYGSESVQGTRTFTGNISSSGTLSGTWSETGAEDGSSTWSTTAGAATPVTSNNWWH